MLTEYEVLTLDAVVVPWGSIRAYRNFLENDGPLPEGLFRHLPGKPHWAAKAKQRRNAEPSGPASARAGNECRVMPLSTRFSMRCSEHHDPDRLPNCARCLIAVVTDASKDGMPVRSRITHSVELPWPVLTRQTSGPGKMGKNGGAHNVHTLGFRSGHTGSGLGRIEEVFGSSQCCFKARSPVSSPTSGTAFPQFRGLTASECAHLCCVGPFGGQWHISTLAKHLVPVSLSGVVEVLQPNIRIEHDGNRMALLRGVRSLRR